MVGTRTENEAAESCCPHNVHLTVKLSYILIMPLFQHEQLTVCLMLTAEVVSMDPTKTMTSKESINIEYTGRDASKNINNEDFF